jgi:ADP-dependent NAD(P)H-hydrate dehydratase / NAD(P)H-hydrate epimerase
MTNALHPANSHHRSPLLALFDSAAVRSLDRAACDANGIESFALMQRAGTRVAQIAMARWPNAQRIVVVCGPGNNGGDGYVAALALKKAVRDVQVYVTHAPQSADAKRAAAQWMQAGGQSIDIQQLSDQVLAGTELLIDAIFGIGARALDGSVADAVQRINDAQLPVIAIDLPSGLDADTGATALAVRAALSVTMIARKAGMHTGKARDYCGEILLESLDIPEHVLQSQKPVAYLQSGLQYLPVRRRPSAHKGDSGHVLCIGGDQNMGGAIRLTAEAALRAGAGIVSVRTHAAHVPGLISARPELLVEAIDDQPLGCKRRIDVLVIGPGLGQGSWAQTLLDQALSLVQQHRCALVLDADALNLLAIKAFALPANTVLTPHPLEAARLLACEVSDIERDRYRAVRTLAQRHNSMAVLKGAGSLIADPDGAVRVCALGNPGMAVAGMGDVLTGTVAAMLAQQLSAWQAACDGVIAHAFAGDWAARNGERGMCASDVIGCLRRAVNP